MAVSRLTILHRIDRAADQTYISNSLVERMKLNGFYSGPVNVVRMVDGGITGFCNMSILAACQAGVDIGEVI